MSERKREKRDLPPTGRNSARISKPTTSDCRIELVPSKGLEPPHPCGYMDLNHARLPIPPRWPGYDCGSFRHFGRSGSDRRTTKPASRKELHPYSTEASLAVKPTTSQNSVPRSLRLRFELQALAIKDATEASVPL